MKIASITLGGAMYSIAPLKSLQVAELFDSMTDAAETKVATFTRSLRTVARSIQNVKGQSSGIDSLSEDDAIDLINDTAEWQEVDGAFGAVLDLSGLRKKAEGEATAAGSISSESSVAL